MSSEDNNKVLAGAFPGAQSNLRDNVDVKLIDASATELAKRPIEYSTGFTLLPGQYTIKFLARDDETGRMGTYQEALRNSRPQQGDEAAAD